MTSIANRFETLRQAAPALTALSVCLLAGVSGVAHATTAAAPAPTVTVPYGDLNLASTKGSDALHARIVFAARQVCAVDDVNIRNLHELALAQSCERAAIAHAEESVSGPKMAAR
jgi:UrcA family protein